MLFLFQVSIILLLWVVQQVRTNHVAGATATLLMLFHPSGHISAAFSFYVYLSSPSLSLSLNLSPSLSLSDTHTLPISQIENTCFSMTFFGEGYAEGSDPSQGRPDTRICTQVVGAGLSAGCGATLVSRLQFGVTEV